MTTLKFTITGRYEAEAEHYDLGDEPTPEQMAAIDQGEYDSGGIGVHDIIEWASDRDLEVKFTTEET